jgi:hypothetical protein
MSIPAKLYQVNPNGISNNYGDFKIAVVPPMGGIVRYNLDGEGPFTQGIVTLIIYEAIDPADAREPAVLIVVDARPPKAPLSDLAT